MAATLRRQHARCEGSDLSFSQGDLKAQTAKGLSVLDQALRDLDSALTAATRVNEQKAASARN